MRLENRRSFLKKTALVASAFSVLPVSVEGKNKDLQIAKDLDATIATPEWRNRQAGMEYRQLGRTGLMISAMVIGGGRLNPNNYKFLFSGIERGINYVDTAWRYGKGRSEEGVGALIKSVGRDKLFVSTKLSPYQPLIDAYCDDVFKGLPQAKQQEVREQSKSLMEQLGVLKSGYYYKFFPTQEEEYHRGFLTYVIRKKYGLMNKWKDTLKKELHASIDQSLQRLGTDYIDILHCPHGARLPEELDDPLIAEVLDEAKRMGKVRFSGLSIHSDIPRNLDQAVDLGHYDMAMVAYNIVNQGTVDQSINRAVKNGMGIVAMKAAAGVHPNYGSLRPVPEWRISKLNNAIPDSLKLPLKAYLWVHQNPKISGMISDFKNKEMVEENLSIIGKRIQLNAI